MGVAAILITAILIIVIVRSVILIVVVPVVAVVVIVIGVNGVVVVIGVDVVVVFSHRQISSSAWCCSCCQFSHVGCWFCKHCWYMY
jgi:hypothetical protein